MGCRDEERLFALVRASVENVPLRSEPFDGMDGAAWERLFGLCASQGVLALVWPAVSVLLCRPPRNLLIRWALSDESIRQRYEMQQSATEALSGLYADNGIRMAVLKGAGLARYYPDPSARECGDVDIWLFGEYERGNRAALDAGASADHVTRKHAALMFRGVLVENHRTFLDVSGSRIDRKLERILAGEVPYFEEYGSCWIPSPRFNALFLMRHASRHLIHGFTLRSILDWGLFLARDGERAGWDRTAAVMRDFGLSSLADTFTGVAERTTGADLSRFIIDGRNPGLEKRLIDRMLAGEGELPPSFAGRVRFKLSGARDSRWLFSELLPDSYCAYLFKAARLNIIKETGRRRPK